MTEPTVCVNGDRCEDRVDGQPRETPAAGMLCDTCVDRAAARIWELPTRWSSLQTMVGEKHTGVDVGIRQKPGSTVLLNLHVDTLIGDIRDTLITAAEVLADKLNIQGSDGRPLDLTVTPRRDTTGKVVGHTARTPHDQVTTAARIVARNVTTLTTIRGVGGRPADDNAIDVMFWNTAGTLTGVTATTGTRLVQKLNELAALTHFTLGQTRARTTRDLPCTRCNARTVGRWAGSEYFDCTSCSARFQEDDLRRQDKVLIELIKRGLVDAPR